MTDTGDTGDVGATDEQAEGRQDTVRRIRANAEDRDELADARDDVADVRDTAADLKSFLNNGEYGDGLEPRRAAALDRRDSKQDRALAAEDREDLSTDVPKPPSGTK